MIKKTDKFWLSKIHGTVAVLYNIIVYRWAGSWIVCTWDWDLNALFISFVWLFYQVNKMYVTTNNIDLFTSVSLFSFLFSAVKMQLIVFFPYLTRPPFVAIKCRWCCLLYQPFSTFSFSRSRITCLSWLSSSNLLSLSFLSAPRRSLSRAILPENKKQNKKQLFKFPLRMVTVWQ